MNDSTRQVQIDPAHAERVVSDSAAAVGLPVPTDAAGVVELLTRLDYACTPNTLDEFKRKGYIGDCGDAWDTTAIYALLGAMECRRRWRPTPSRHDTKKSGARIQIEQLRAAGVNPVDGIEQHTIEDMLIWLTQSDDRMLREAIYEALRIKLDGLEE